MQHMESEDEAKAAIAALDGYSLKGSHIHVEVGLIQPLTVLQVSYASRKVMEFKKKFQACKVMENDNGHGNSWKINGIPPICHGIF